MTRFKWGFDMLNVNSVAMLSFRTHGPDISIWGEEEDAMPAQFFFSSRHLNDLDDPAEVCARADQLKTLFDGALFLRYGHNFQPERISELWDLERETRHGRPASAPGIQPFSPKVCALALTGIERDAVSSDFDAGALYAARTDDVVRGVLESLGTHGITWTLLYALTDTMKTTGFADQAQWTAGGATKAEYETFKHTANSFAALGPAARHGQTRNAPPKKPMSIDRAAEIILSATKAFVTKRIRRTVAPLGIPKSPAAPSAAPPVQPPSAKQPTLAASDDPVGLDTREAPTPNLKAAAPRGSGWTRPLAVAGAAAALTAIALFVGRSRRKK